MSERQMIVAGLLLFFNQWPLAFGIAGLSSHLSESFAFGLWDFRMIINAKDISIISEALLRQ